MSPKHTPKRSAASSSTTGVKMLLTAASLAAVVGGWAGFTVHQSRTTAQNEVVLPDDPSQASLELLPLPTLVPEPSPVAGLRNVAVVPGISPIVAAPVPGLTAPTPVVASSSGGGSSESKDRPGKGEKKAKPDPVSDTRPS